MARVVVVNHLTLDGVMQAPGRPDEGRRGGFQEGGVPAGLRLTSASSTANGAIVANYEKEGSR